MSIVRDNGDERQVRVDRMVDELRKAQSRRLAKAATVKDTDQGVEPQLDAHARRRSPGQLLHGLHTRMTGWTMLLDWVGVPWPRSASVPQRPTRIFPMEQNTPQVPREYRALYTYLERRYASVVVLTFEQIEALLGFALPRPARTEREWWTNIADTQRHSAAWMEAGRSAAPNLGAGTITFERQV